MTVSQPKSIDWTLDRDLNIPVAEQIKGKIVYAISFGSLPPGEALPSVRALAQALKVSPVTVSKVYKELTQDGLLVARPSVGVFVSELGLENGRQNFLASNAKLEQILENSIRQARFLGYTLDEISETWGKVAERIRNQEKKRTILIVGNFVQATRFYAEQIKATLQDLNLKVESITFNELLPQINAYQDLLDRASLIVTLPQNIQNLRNALKPSGCRIVAIAFELSPDTIQRLSAITPDQRVGILSTFPDFVQTMVDDVESYGGNSLPPKIAVLSDGERIKDILKDIDVLVYATGSEQMLALLPKNIITIQLLHQPKLESVHRLRTLIS